MKFKPRTLRQLADMICGNFDAPTTKFVYRSSGYLTEFFEDCETHYRHNGTTRAHWVATVLAEVLDLPQGNPHSPPPTFQAVIRRLMDRADATNEGADRSEALAMLNTALAPEGYQAFYAEDGLCYLRHTQTNTVVSAPTNPQRPLSNDEIEKRALLSQYLDSASEDELITEILLPLFRQLGFRRITAAGHKDKALEYGKDVWMKFTLPTMHSLYFGIQAKRDKLDAAGKTQNANIAEVLTQIRMMLGHKVFDPEINKRALVDHAIIVSGGEITKQARNWLGEQLDASSRSQILFMEREDILNLYVVNSIPLPQALVRKPDQAPEMFDDLPF